jgi:DNA-directed RNA polymerase specialized sigma24 family protein
MYEDIIKRLKNYKFLKAEIKALELDIEEMKDDIGVDGMDYGKDKISPTNKFNSTVENSALRIAQKELDKRRKEREIERIDNAVSILDDKEKEVITLRHIENRRWDTVTYKLDRTYDACKKIEQRTLRKMSKFLKQ